MAAKQHATQQPWDHWRNQRENKRIPRNKQKRKHNGPQLLGCSKPHWFPVCNVGIVIPTPQLLTRVHWERRWNSPGLPVTEPARSCGTREWYLGGGFGNLHSPRRLFSPAGKEASHDRTTTGQDVITGGCNSATTWDGSPALPDNDQGLLERWQLFLNN